MPILLPSVQSLLIQLKSDDQQLATGTGFVAEANTGPVLITNRHIVTGRHNLTGQPISPTGAVPNNVTIMHNRHNKLGYWIPKQEALYEADLPKWIEHPALGARADFVALPLTELGDIQLYSYSLGVADPQIRVSPSDIVSVVGFPFGKTGGGALAIWATGFVATEPDIDFEDEPKFLIDCRARQGQSGSAVIAHRNGGTVSMDDGSTAIFGGPVTRFIGIYSGRINAESDLGIVWKAKAIKELVDSIH